MTKPLETDGNQKSVPQNSEQSASQANEDESFDFDIPPSPNQLDREFTLAQIEHLVRRAHTALNELRALLQHAVVHDQIKTYEKGRETLLAVIALLRQRAGGIRQRHQWAPVVASEVLNAGDLLRGPKDVDRVYADDGAERKVARERAKSLIRRQLSTHFDDRWTGFSEDDWSGSKFVNELCEGDALSDDEKECETLFDSLAEISVRYSETGHMTNALHSVLELMHLIGYADINAYESFQRAVSRERSR